MQQTGRSHSGAFCSHRDVSLFGGVFPSYRVLVDATLFSRVPTAAAMLSFLGARDRGPVFRIRLTDIRSGIYIYTKSPYYGYSFLRFRVSDLRRNLILSVN